MKRKFAAIIAPLVMTLATVGLLSCDPKEIDSSDSHITSSATSSSKAVLLCEGSWSSNNASLSLVDNHLQHINNDWFSAVNNRNLGDVAQDIVVYGSKIYVTVTFSNSLEVIDTATGLSTRLPLGDRSPRHIAAANGHLYITCYRPRSVISIDTATLQIDGTCLLGDYNPEGIAAIGEKLFIASSWIQRNNNYERDSLLYVVDASSLTIDSTLVVGHNPQQVEAIADRWLAVTFSGDYADIQAGCSLVDIVNMSVIPLQHPFTAVSSLADTLYGYCRSDYGASATASYHRIVLPTMTTDEIRCDVNTPYGISVDPRNGDLYITTDGNYRSSGQLVVVSRSGVERYRATAGLLPRKAVFF